MTDNSLRTPGTGESIRTDDRGGSGIKTQVVLLDRGAEAEAERIGFPPHKIVSDISAGLTIAATAYTSGDQVGTIFEFPQVVPVTGLSAVVRSLVMLDMGNVMTAADLYLFDRSITLGADNAAAAWTDADHLFCQGVIPIPTPAVGGNNKASQAVSGLPLVVTPGDGGTSIFGALVTRGANSFFVAVTDLTLKLGVTQD